MRPHRLRRLPNSSYTGFWRYSLTFCVCERHPLFAEAEYVKTVWEQILRASSSCHFAIVAYCFMPDHLHLLVEGTSPEACLPDFVKLAKQQSAFVVKCLTGRALWQTGYFERVLRDEEESWAVAAYIIDNPVRAGLIQSPLAYPFSGSDRYGMDALLKYLQHRA
jgi:putative transposase